MSSPSDHPSNLQAINNSSTNVLPPNTTSNNEEIGI